MMMMVMMTMVDEEAQHSPEASCKHQSGRFNPQTAAAVLALSAAVLSGEEALCCWRPFLYRPFASNCGGLSEQACLHYFISTN